MSISLGSSTISNIYLGSSTVTAAYLGATQVFPEQQSYVTGGLQFYVDAGESTSYPGSGSTWYDLSGNAIDVTLTGTPTYSSSSGSYIAFNGSGQYGVMATPLAEGDTTYSYFVVVVPEVNNTTMILYQGNESTYRRGAMIQCGGTTNPLMGFNGFDNDSIVGCGGVVETTLGTWQSLAFTLDEVASVPFFLYKNGILEESGSATNGATNLNLGTNFARIAANGNNGEQFTGKIAVCMVYDRTLTTAEIEQNHNYFASRYDLTTV
jgi:hypothetical protein